MDQIPLSVLFGALAFLIILSAFFSGSETGLMTLNRYRLRHLVRARHPAAIRAQKLLERPDRLIGLILLGNNFVNILSDEESGEFPHGFITEEFLKGQVTDLKKYFYLCGPYPMMKAVEQILSGLGVDDKLIIKERF